MPLPLCHGPGVRKALPITIAVLFAACSDANDAAREDTSSPDTGDVALDADDLGDIDVAEDGPPPQRLCNGAAHICDMPFDRLVLPGTHNSMAARDADFVAPNHEFGIARQLDDGIRAMLLDTYRWRDEYYLCHGHCRLGATPASEGLGEIRAFLDSNPDEVLVIIFQNAITPEETVEMLEAADLVRFAMTPRATDWPTVAELIDAGERMLVTLESGAGPPWLPHAWDVFFDSPYSFSSPDQFTCETNRGASDNSLHLLNHWLADPLPMPELGAEANTYEQLSARVASCRSVGVFPNVVAVDFYDTGALFDVVAELNAELPE